MQINGKFYFHLATHTFPAHCQQLFQQSGQGIEIIFQNCGKGKHLGTRQVCIPDAVFLRVIGGTEQAYRILICSLVNITRNQITAFTNKT